MTGSSIVVASTSPLNMHIVVSTLRGNLHGHTVFSQYGTVISTSTSTALKAIFEMTLARLWVLLFLRGRDAAEYEAPWRYGYTGNFSPRMI